MFRYYSTQRPIGPGAFPGKPVNIENFDRREKVPGIGLTWGYLEYREPLDDDAAKRYELKAVTSEAEAEDKIVAIEKARGMAREYDAESINSKVFAISDENSGDICDAGKKKTWFPVTISSRKHGGGLRVNSGQIVKSLKRPADKKSESKNMQWKTRYFSTWEEAQRIMYVVNNLSITVNRVRMNATQGEVKVFVNEKYILNFGDKIVLPERRTSPENYYGDDIGGWRSSEPDSSFVLGLIWHPLDYVYHYSERICKTLGITQEEWIEGNYWNREGRIWRATEN